MTLPLNQYKTIIFDCDGVILNSNKIKTDAFYLAAIDYGKNAAETLRKYHVDNGGISRFKKFEYFLTNIINSSVSKPELDSLLNNFSDILQQELLACECTTALPRMREITANASWLVCSGSPQTDLRQLLNERGISHFFNSGVFGSPDTKEDILGRLKETQGINMPALFIGDSKYDFLVAEEFGLDFIFVHEWTEFYDWQSFFKNKNISIYKSLSSLVHHEINGETLA